MAMKIRIVVPLLVCSAFVTLGALVFMGCSHLERLYNKEVQELASDPIGTNTTFRTNFVVMEEASTNEDGVITPAKMAAVVRPEVVVQYALPTYVTTRSVSGFVGIQGTLLLVEEYFFSRCVMFESDWLSPKMCMGGDMLSRRYSQTSWFLENATRKPLLTTSGVVILTMYGRYSVYYSVPNRLLHTKLWRALLSRERFRGVDDTFQ
jgi:hypothetical protein